MKRKMCALFMIVTVLVSLTGCGKFTCAFCEEEKSGKKYESEILGEEVVICQDCYDEIQELFSGF